MPALASACQTILPSNPTLVKLCWFPFKILDEKGLLKGESWRNVRVLIQLPILYKSTEIAVSGMVEELYR